MQKSLRIPVACPVCGKELLTEFPAAAIAEALASGDSIRLQAPCHGKTWHASPLEREQFRQYLDAANLPRSAGPNLSRDRSGRDPLLGRQTSRWRRTV
jgi:hypothetical protein